MIWGGSSTKQQRSVGDAKHTQTRSAVPVTLLQSHFFHHGQHSAFWVPRPQDLTLPHAAFTIAQTSCVLGAQTAGLNTSTACAPLRETRRLSTLLLSLRASLLYRLTPPNARPPKHLPSLNRDAFDKHIASRFALAFECIVASMSRS